MEHTHSAVQQTACPLAWDYSGGKIAFQGFVICFTFSFVGSFYRNPKVAVVKRQQRLCGPWVTFLKTVRPAKQPERKDLTVLICFLWFMGGKNISHIIRAATERLY